MILIFDMDETLLTSFHVEKTDIEYGKGIWISHGNEREYVIVRPYAFDLLRFCKDNFFKLILCTYSESVRMKCLLMATGLGKFFDEIYSRCNIHNDKCIIPETEFLLIDDHRWNSSLTLRKLEFFGMDLDTSPFAVQNRVLYVSPFEGYTKDAELCLLKRHLEKKVNVAV